METEKSKTESSNVEKAWVAICKELGELDAGIALRLLEYIGTDIRMRVEWELLTNVQNAPVNKEQQKEALA